MLITQSVALFILAGLFEIGGGYLVWQWWRNEVTGASGCSARWASMRHTAMRCIGYVGRALATGWTSTFSTQLNK